MPGRGLGFRLLAIGLSLLLVCALGEIAVRVAGRRTAFVDTAVRERISSPSHAPDFRGRPGPLPRSPGGVRILTLGDSFAWGDGVHAADAWPLRLERRLSELRPGLTVEVVNWSHTGWNAHQIWTSVRPRLASLDPDLVILGFTLNDPEPSRSSERQRLMAPLERRAPAAAPSRLLYGGSAFYRLFWDRIENRRQRRAFVAYYRGLYQGPGWRACRAALAGLRDATGRMEVPLLLVIFPIFDSQLDDSYPYQRLHNKTASAARELDIPVLDLLRHFRGADARRLAVTPFTDPHPSDLAHRIAADQIADHLLAAGMLSQPARTSERDGESTKPAVALLAEP